MEKWIWFDMDGTIADLYGIDGWETRLGAEDPAPYTEARPLVSCAALARTLHKAQGAGYRIGILSWTSLDSSVPYHKAVINAKKKWLFAHLPSVTWDAIRILPYGTPKHLFATDNAILFDDNNEIRRKWTGVAFSEKNLVKNLARLCAKPNLDSCSLNRGLAFFVLLWYNIDNENGKELIGNEKT